MRQAQFTGLVLLVSVLHVFADDHQRLWVSTNSNPEIFLMEDCKTGGGTVWLFTGTNVVLLSCPAFDYGVNRFLATNQYGRVLVLDYIRSTESVVQARHGPTNRIFHAMP